MLVGHKQLSLKEQTERQKQTTPNNMVLGVLADMTGINSIHF